jgi:NADPH:quinone reductase-like Zn-dependent oxidoreductase
MKAIVYDKYGSPDVLSFEEIEKPRPKDDEVLVKVAAVSLNTSDWECLCGRPAYARIFGLLRPRHRVLGSDVTGTVEAVGNNVNQLQVGDEVFGDTMGTFGGFAEYACVHEKVLMKKPSSLSFEQTATIPQAAIIALQGLRQGGELQPGQKVLINGAGGGSGMFAIQLAKLRGAEVTGVDNGNKLEHMRAMGADHVIDYTQVDFAKAGVKYDLILDLVGTRSAAAHNGALNRGGRYVIVGGTMASLLQTWARVMVCWPRQPTRPTSPR